MKFLYNDADLDALDSTLSKDRLHRYVRLGGGDRKKAVQFYEMNNLVSESLFGVIRGLEVPLRNSVHNIMTKEIGHPDWYDRIKVLEHRELASISSAKAAIEKSAKPVIPSRVISELSMGFWCGLTSKIYDASLWVPHLHKAFPHVKIGRKAANKRLERIRLIRNRIAHHECILDYKLSNEYALVIEAIRWICPVTAEWVKHNSTLEQRLEDLANFISPPVQLTVDEIASTVGTAEDN